MYHSYSLTRAWDGEDVPFAQSFTTSDDDAINCAHMLAAGFNTMSRNFTNGFVLAVVDTTAGTVQYDGKTEQIKRDDPWSVSTTMHFTADPDGDNLVTLFDNENGRLVFPGKLKFAETTTDEVLTKASADLAESAAGHIARSVLEEAYAEVQAVKNVLFEAGFETIPADRGVQDMCSIIRARDMEIAELVQQRANQNAAARDEIIEYARGAYEKLNKVDPGRVRKDLQDRYRGVLDVLANLLVATGEADRDERHAVARRLVERPED